MPRGWTSFAMITRALLFCFRPILSPPLSSLRSSGLRKSATSFRTHPRTPAACSLRLDLRHRGSLVSEDRSCSRRVANVGSRRCVHFPSSSKEARFNEIIKRFPADCRTNYAPNENASLLSDLLPNPPPRSHYHVRSRPSPAPSSPQFPRFYSS